MVRDEEVIPAVRNKLLLFLATVYSDDIDEDDHAAFPFKIFQYSFFGWYVKYI